MTILRDDLRTEWTTLPTLEANDDADGTDGDADGSDDGDADGTDGGDADGTDGDADGTDS